MGIIIYCLEGLHGVGKSTICNNLKEMGYSVIDEGFMTDEDFDDYITSFKGDDKSHTFALELEWVGRMFKKICKICSLVKKGDIDLKDNVIFTDRSCLTPPIYGALTAFGELGFLSVCRDIINYIEDEFDVKFFHVYISRPNLDDVYEKISERLIKEPIRENLKEGSFEFLVNIQREYDIREKFFDKFVHLDSFSIASPESDLRKLLIDLDIF